MPQPTDTEITQAVSDYVLIEQLAKLRVERNGLLAASDWTDLPNAQLSAEQKNAWQTYRQELRDLPENTVDPENPVWPIAPAD